ncbi:hypothetical protein DSO57_1031144 [Entomophthora muscae]|uniref:Uncharacterized protein n=1 Tax=Entomophthora muscae TaxID=34485 RepID=A0ACC2SQ57_9FUNG|nr:hypothetical protein DSO57_1031144 [Entomophthora muscae]
MSLEIPAGVMEDLPWFIWEEVISFLGTRERWILLTLDRIWRDKVVADSLQVVCFKSDPLACRSRQELKRGQAKVKSLNMFSSKNVDPEYFMRSYPKLKHLLLNNFSHDKALVHIISHGVFSECFKQLTCLTILDTLELSALQKILAQTESLEVLGINVSHLSTNEIITGVFNYSSWFNLKKVLVDIDSLDLEFLSVVAERFKKLQHLRIYFLSCTPDLIIYCRHLPRNLVTLALKSSHAFVTLDLNITKDIVFMNIGLDFHLINPQQIPCIQALKDLRLQNISITTASEILDHFPNVTKMLLKCSSDSEGIAKKLVYGLKKLKFLKLENVKEGDSLFEGSALEISSLILQMSRVIGSKPICFILTAFRNLSRLTVGFYIARSVCDTIDYTSLPKLHRLQSLNVLKRQACSTYKLLLKLSPSLVSLTMPKRDYEEYHTCLQTSHPLVNFIPSH